MGKIIKLRNSLYMISLTFLAYLIYAVIRNISPVISYPYLVDWTGVFKVCFWSIILFVLPCLIPVSTYFKDRFDFIERLVIAFGLGISFGTMIGLIHKYLNLNFSKNYILLLYGLAYFILYLIIHQLSKISLFESIKCEIKPLNKNVLIDYSILIISLLVVIDFILRTRSSSLILSGDQGQHFYMTIPVFLDGPFYDKLAFFNKFFPNWYPGGFNNILATLKTVTDLSLVDIFRYFPIFIGCFWILSIYMLAKNVINNRKIAAIITLVALGISGGLNESEIPLIFFSNAWALGWVLTATIFSLSLVGIKNRQKSCSSFAGIILGSAVLIQPLLLWRLLPIATLYIIVLAIQRKIGLKELEFLGRILVISVCIIGSWAIPLYLKYGFWNKVPFAVINGLYGGKYPELLEWVKWRLSYVPSIKEFFKITVTNSGYLPMVLSIFGISAFFHKKKTNETFFMIVWLIAVFFLIMFKLTSRPTRMFEYMFFAMIILSGIGLKYLIELYEQIMQSNNKIIPITILIILLFRFNFFYLPKYNRTLDRFNRNETISTKKSSDYSSRMEEKYIWMRNSENGLTEHFGSRKNLLLTLNPDFWEIYIKYAEEKKTK